MKDLISIGCVGDLILDEPGPMEPYFEDSRDDLRKIDVLIGQVETPHTRRAQPSSIEIQAPPSNPDHLNVLADVGFHIATMAGNHTYDCGPFGVIDTADKLRELGIIPCGAGANIYEAKTPAFIERNGIKVGVLDYNTVGPSWGWAMSSKPGCAYVEILTVNRGSDMPGAPAKVYTFVEPDAKKQLMAEIAELKKQCDIAVVVYHKGAAGKRTDIGLYETEISQASIDAGADIVFAHHAHMLKGVEIYKGKPIFHGLGNFVTVTYAMTPGKNESPEMVAYMKRREREGRGKAVYDPPYYPWTEETLDTMIARVMVDKTGVREIGYIPYRIDKSCEPRKLSRDNGGQEVFDNVVALTRGIGLETEFKWSEDGSYVIVS